MGKNILHKMVTPTIEKQNLQLTKTILIRKNSKEFSLVQ